MSDRPFPRIESNLPQSIERWLGQLLDKPVTIRFTSNQSTMISSREQDSTLAIRVHRMFVGAPEAIWISLAHYLLCEDRASGEIIDQYIETHIQEFSSPPTKVHPIGKFHDLEQLFHQLNGEFFHDRCEAKITWGRPTSSRQRQSIQLGSYASRQRLIRIHPCLDQYFVPHYYVAWIIHHEMLHEAFGEETINGRRCIHPPEFRILEESYPDYSRCKAWEQKHLNRLLNYHPPAARS